MTKPPGSPAGAVADGGRVVVWGDDHIVQVGLGQQGLEERVWIRQPIGCNDALVCDESIPPAHGVGQLTAPFNEE